jgi:hypothetical protein
MPDEPDGKTRATKLRARIAKLKRASAEKSAEDTEDGPRPGESPNAYVERRMRETLKKGRDTAR